MMAIICTLKINGRYNILTLHEINIELLNLIWWYVTDTLVRLIKQVLEFTMILIGFFVYYERKMFCIPFYFMHGIEFFRAVQL